MFESGLTSMRATKNKSHFKNPCRCDLVSPGVANVTFNSLNWAQYAHRKLNGFEYPPGKLVVLIIVDPRPTGPGSNINLIFAILMKQMRKIVCILDIIIKLKLVIFSQNLLDRGSTVFRDMKVSRELPISIKECSGTPGYRIVAKYVPDAHGSSKNSDIPFYPISIELPSKKALGEYSAT